MLKLGIHKKQLPKAACMGSAVTCKRGPSELRDAGKTRYAVRVQYVPCSKVESWLPYAYPWIAGWSQMHEGKDLYAHDVSCFKWGFPLSMTKPHIPCHDHGTYGMGMVDIFVANDHGQSQATIEHGQKSEKSSPYHHLQTGSIHINYW